MNGRKARALRRLLNYEPSAGYAQKRGDTLIATGPRRTYQMVKRNPQLRAALLRMK